MKRLHYQVGNTFSTSQTALLFRRYFHTFLITLASAATFATGYDWTSSDGRKLTAEFVSLGESSIKVRANGRELDLPFDRVIPEDVEAAKRFTILGDDTLIDAASRQVDTLLATRLKAAGIESFNTPISDDVFVRRVYLDIIGRIPVREEYLAFQTRSEPNKRNLLIDELLLDEASHYPLYNYFADMFRLHPNTYTANGRGVIYMNWWREQLKKNTPYDEIVRAMILATGSMADNPASGYLLRDYGMELDAFSNFSQQFLGIDLSCAQCHDDPFTEWTQKDFFQMAAFFGQTQRKIAQGSPWRDEDWIKDFTEYATENGEPIHHNQNPAVWRYKDEINLGIFDDPDLDFVLPESFIGDDGSPGQRVRPLPLFGEAPDIKGQAKGREMLAEWLLSDSNPRFSLVIANRMWERAFGRALIQPINSFESIRLSPQPEALQFLGDQMKRLNYNLRAYMRVLYRTRAYQSEPAHEEPEAYGDYLFAGPLLRRMRAEQIWDSYMGSIAGPEVDHFAGDDGAFEQWAQTIDYSDKSFEDAFHKMTTWKRLKDPSAGQTIRLSPDGGEPSAIAAPKVAHVRTYRAGTFRFPDHGHTFIPIFGESSRLIMDDHNYNSSIPQALALMNHSHIGFWSDRLARQISEEEATPEEQITGIFNSLLSRPPTPTEKAECLKVMAGEADSLKHVVWAILNSPEFLFVQ